MIPRAPRRQCGDAVLPAHHQLERRRGVIQRWADFVGGKEGGNIIELRRAAE
jgi:hypothetical protein